MKGRDWNGEGLEESEWRARGRWRGSKTLNVINAEEINKENHTYSEASDLILFFQGTASHLLLLTLHSAVH